ncbi:MAG: antibiotic biosynthesis monooxygenase [Saccharospirillaceae bacterium]|nr:antibiotic biosynthesis monooxygenase [Pseudomonadales bacterium]NRB78892.1 antibiotic biosynthesis monooxygenase [Saccharospirillaceae bacterium]
MSIRVQLDANAKPECVAELSGAIAEMFPETRKYDGNIDINAFLSEDGHSFSFVETWETKAQYETYLAWREETGTMAKLGALLQEPPTIKFYNAVQA